MSLMINRILPVGKTLRGTLVALILATMVAPLCSPVGIAAPAANPKQANPLSGQIHQTVRVPRPGVPVLQPLNGKSAANRLDVHLDTSLFNQAAPSEAAVAPMQSTITASPLPSVPPLRSAPLIPDAPAVVPLETATARTSGGTSKTSPREGAGTGGGDFNNDYGKKEPRTGKKVLIRIKKFRAGQEMEVVWEAARVANAMARKGANVTVFLDMEAVHAANKSDTMNATYEPNRGNGNTAAPRLTSPQDLLEQFVQNGGRLCISERWAKLFGMAGGGSHALAGSELLNDEAIADLLLETDNCIDY